MEAFILKLIFAALFSFFFTFYLVPICCLLAAKLRVMDVPDGIVKRHTSATPYLGGIAVYAGFIGALALTYPFENRIFLLIVGSTVLLFVGLIDDVLVTTPAQKFFGQLIAMFCFLKASLYLKEHFFYKIWTIPVSLFWILSIVNAFNLIDVMDGLATLTALCATATFLCIALYSANYPLALLLSAFLGALAAFFYYNKPPARIYLGDAGALFIGGFLATVPFLFEWGTYNWYGFFTPPVILAIPCLEICQLIIVRLSKGISPFRASPDHFSLLLLAKGWSKYKILLFVFILSLFLGVVAGLFFKGDLTIFQLVGVGVFTVFIWVVAIFYGAKKG